MSIPLRKNAAELIKNATKIYEYGLCEGTYVLTDSGMLRVEMLCVGDIIITKNGQKSVLSAITVRQKEAINLYKLRPDCLGSNRPMRNTYVAPGQLLEIRDWRAQALFGSETALTPVWRLADGTYIREMPPRPATLYDLKFDRPCVFFANGLAFGGQMAEMDSSKRVAA